jgi:hypothetical protein
MAFFGCDRQARQDGAGSAPSSRDNGVVTASAPSIDPALVGVDAEVVARATIIFDGRAMRGRGAYRPLPTGGSYHESFEGFHVEKVLRGQLKSTYLAVERLDQRIRNGDAVVVLLRPDPALGADYDGGKPSRKLQESEVLAVVNRVPKPNPAP